MRKRIASGLILACFLVPSVMYIRDLFTGAINVPNVARAMSESAVHVKAWFTDQEAKAYEAEIAAEAERLAVDVKDTQALLASMPSGRRGELERHLAGLIKEREAVLDVMNAHLDNLNASRLAYAEFFLMKARSENVRRQTPHARTVLDLRMRQEQSAAVRLERQLAKLVNSFLDAVEQDDFQEVRDSCAKGLRPSLTREKIRLLAKTAPGGAMTFEPAPNGFVVVRFSDRPEATLTLAAGENGVEITALW